MATQERHEEHHKKSESHEEHEDHVKNQSNQGGGILSYLTGAAGFGGSDNKTEQDNINDGDNQAHTTRSGAQYGQGGRDNQRANEDYGSTGKYDTDNFDNKQSTEGVTAGGYSDRADIRNDDDVNRGRNQGSNLTGTQTGRSSTPSSNQGYGSQGNRGDVDRTQTTRTEGYGTEGYGGRSSGDRDTTHVGKHGVSGDDGRNTGYTQGSNDQSTYNSGTVGEGTANPGSYNQGSDTRGTYNQGSDTLGAYNQGTRNQSTDIGTEGRGHRQGTENQGYSHGKEAEFGNQQTGYGNQQTGYGQEATRQNEPDNGVRGAPIEGDNVKGYAVSAPVGSGDTSNIDNSGQPSGQVSGAHMEYLPRESDNRDHTGRGTVGRTQGDGDSSFANVKRTIPGGTEHVVTKTSNSHIEHTSTTQM